MTQAQALLLKFGLVLVALVGAFALVGLGKLDAATMFERVATLIGQLVLALGVSGAGAAIAASSSSSSAPGAPPGTSGNVLASRRPAYPPPSITGLLRRSLLLVPMLAAIVFFLVALIFCAPPPKLPPGVVEPAICGLRVYAEDTAVHKSWPLILEDELTECGLDEIASTKLLAEHKRAMAVTAGALVLEDGGAP